MQNNLAWANPAGSCPKNQRISLNGTVYSLVWTVHAAHRAEYRKCTGSIVINAFIKNFLTDIAKTKEFNDASGYVTIRDFKTYTFAVIHINKVSKCIMVITCGDVMKINPQNGDVVIQRDNDGKLSCYTWKKPCTKHQ